MATWTKKDFDAAGVTEYPVGPALDQLRRNFGGSVVLALDVSGSMEGERIEKAVRGCRRFICEAVEANSSVGLILWAHGISGSVPVDYDPSAAYCLLAQAAIAGGTNIVPCLELAHRMLLDARASDMVLAVFGDGDLGDPFEASRVAAKLTADGIRILTCGLGQSSAESLAIISTETSTTRVAETSTIADSIADMARGLRFLSRL